MQDPLKKIGVCWVGQMPTNPLRETVLTTNRTSKFLRPNIYLHFRLAKKKQISFDMIQTKD